MIIILVILTIVLLSLMVSYLTARTKKRKNRQKNHVHLNGIKNHTVIEKEFITEINRLIKENISNPLLGVEAVALHMNISKTTLFNRMNNLTGTSTSKYIKKIRIETAKELLAGTDKSIGQVAIETGFSDSHYFNRVFKQTTGMTPTQYKTSTHQ